MEEITPAPVNVPPKKKHHLRWLWILLIILLVLLLIVFAVLGTFFYFLYDGTDGKSEAKPNRSLDQLENKVIMSAFDTTAKDNKIRLSLDKADLDQLLYYAMENLPKEAKQYINKSYVEISGNDYKFYIQGKYSILKTRVAIDTTISTDLAKRQFVFTVKNITLGKINNLYNMVVDSISEVVSDETFNEAFAENGLHMKFSFKDRTITYGFDDFAKDLINMMDDANAKKNIGPFIKLLFSNDLVGIENNRSDLSLYLDLTKAKFDSKYMTTETPYLDLKAIPSDITSLLKNKKIAYTDASTVFNYLVRGYSLLSEEEKKVIDKTDFSSSTTFTSASTEKQNYKGIIPTVQGNLSIEEELKNNMSTTTISEDGTFGFTILKESYLNNLFRSVNMIGTSVAFAQEVDGEPKLIYLTLDDISTNIVANHLYLLVRINLSGSVATLIYDASLDPKDINQKNFSFTFKEEKITLGSIVADEDIQNLFFQYFTDSLKNIQKNDWLSMDASNRNISLTMENVIKNALKAYGGMDQYIDKCSMKPEVISDPSNSKNPLEGDGQIRLDLSYQA